MQFLYGSVQFVRQFQCIGVWLLGDGDQHSRFAFFRSQTQFGGFGADLHVGNVRQGDGQVVDCLDHSFADFLHMGGSEYTLNNVFVAVFIEDASGGILVHVLHDGKHFIQTDPVVLHAGRVKEDLVFLDVSADDGNLCYPASGQQPWADGPVGNGAEVLQGGCVGSQADNHHFSQNGGLWSQGRLSHVVGEGISDGGKFLGNNLPCRVNISAPFKFHPDHREACC